jgi:hypothetical protein
MYVSNTGKGKTLSELGTLEYFFNFGKESGASV